jgi:predicted O-methyltransferase YrrM
MNTFLRPNFTAVNELIKRRQAFFGRGPQASRARYHQLYEEARQIPYPELDQWEQRLGYAIDRPWLDNLALHTQIIIKKSRLNYQHGRLLYTTLRHYLTEKIRKSGQLDSGQLDSGQLTILETGTARGFSAVVMAKALIDSGVAGKILTLDIVPHNAPLFWNCIDDHEGRKTRQELLSPWLEELEHIIFIQGWTDTQLQRTGLARIHFAFIDAQHRKMEVLDEYHYVCDRQQPGDMIIFDDVTPNHPQFKGVIEAINWIEQDGKYTIQRIASSPERGYGIATKIDYASKMGQRNS